MDGTEAFPRFVEPMLAAPAQVLPEGDEWALELKWDGCRAQLLVDRGHWRVRSRPGRCMTAAFAELAAVVEKLEAHRVVIDGELVCLDTDGKPDFHALRPRLTGSPGRPCTFIAFDVLHLDGRAVRRLPYRERRELLRELLPPAGSVWRVPSALQGSAAAVVDLVAREHLEGVVAKRLDRPYETGRRSRSWSKLKVRRTEKLALTAWSPASRSAPETFFVSRTGADGARQPAGAVQLGLSGDQREALRAAVASRLESSGRRVQRVGRGITLTVDFHGAADRPIRDAVARAFAVD